jgi:hypothetical protein
VGMATFIRFDATLPGKRAPDGRIRRIHSRAHEDRPVRLAVTRKPADCRGRLALARFTGEVGTDRQGGTRITKRLVEEQGKGMNMNTDIEWRAQAVRRLRELACISVAPYERVLVGGAR